MAIRNMILFFTMFLFLFIFPFQLTMAQGPPAPPASPSSPAPPASPAPGAPVVPGTGTTSASGTVPTPGVTPLCNVNNYTPGVSVQLNQTRLKTSGGADVKISGTVSYLDGCRFLISGFTYYFAATGTYWFGSNSTDPKAPSFLVSNTPVGQFISQPANFTLKSDVTFDFFDVLNLYSVDEKEVYAQAVLKTPPAPPSPPENAPAKSDATKLSMNQNMMNKIIFGAFVALFSLILN